MSGLLSGLSGLGLDDLEDVDIFEQPEKKQKEDPAAAAQRQMIQEKDMIYDRSFTCPICDTKFTNKIMKTGKAKLIKMDKDLRPVYEAVDGQKYDVILCPKCGYAAVTRFFSQVTSGQAKLIKEQITKKVQLHEYNGETYSYDEALERYKLALANAVVKRAKNSEKAYICLKTAWLLRGYAEEMEQQDTPQNQLEMVNAMEENNMRNALKGFAEARQTESFPMCGMDEMTIDYLLAVLYIRFGQLDTASKLVSRIITSPGANARTKDKARELKDEILHEMRKADNK